MTVIVVTVEVGTAGGGWEFANEGTTDESGALLTMRTLWDESYTNTQGCRRRITLTAIDPETGIEAVKRFEYRP